MPDRLEDHEGRLRALESWMGRHDAEVAAWWRSQWEANSRVERALDSLARRQDALRLSVWKLTLVVAASSASAAGLARMLL